MLRTAQPAVDTTNGSRDGLYLVVIALALALDAGSVAIINAALPRIGTDLGMGGPVLQLVVTAYAAVFAAFLLFGGRASDRFGRRLLLIIGLSTTALGSVICAVGGATTLLVGRALQGLGAALAGPAALSLVTELFPAGPRRMRALAIYTGVGAASFSGGLALGGVVTESLNWRGVFWCTAIAAGGAAVAGRLILPAGGRDSTTGLDLTGSVTAAVALLLLVVGAGQVSDPAGHSVHWGLIVFGLAVVALVWLVQHERNTPSPVLSGELVRSHAVRLAALAALVFYTALLSVLFFAPILLQTYLHYSPLASALAIGPMGLIVILSANVASRHIDRFGIRATLATGMTLLGLGVLLWAFFSTSATYLNLILPAVVVMSVGQGTAFVALTAASLSDVEERLHGVAGAVNITAQQVGGSVGVALLVLLATAVGPDAPNAAVSVNGARWAFVAAAALCIAFAVTTMLDRRSLRRITTR